MKTTTAARESDPSRHLADYTVTRRIIPIAGLAIVVGFIAAFLAKALLWLIALATNVFFFQRFEAVDTASPAHHSLGPWVVVVPIVGALLVGLIARYGSDRIRGHGIPEAIEAILVRGSVVQPRVALLKPISAAIAIGSGGPFGAEGPIIMTGGAFGSMFAQLFHLTASERKTLLVAGAAAGMSATFDAPVASVLLAVEILLFELKPRSLVPVALASAVACAMRHVLLGSGPVFAVPEHAALLGGAGLAGSALLGLIAGVASCLLTASVYATEDLYKKLPIHWMWWPALGAIAIGIGGLIEPRALGVGYENIETLLGGGFALRAVLVLMVVKWAIWALSLGSGTSGGVLAPLLMVGCCIGALASHWLPDEGAGFWALLGMGAMLAGTMRAPLTAVIFSLELTHDRNAMLPLLVASFVSFAVTALVLKRSILTEKIARRGLHSSHEYAVDPLEVLQVREVLEESVVIPDAAEPGEITRMLDEERETRLFAVVTAEGKLAGVVTRRALEKERALFPALHRSPVVAHPSEPLRVVANRMAESGRTRLPVVEDGALMGMISLRTLLQARAKHQEEEVRRERLLSPMFVIPPAFRRFAASFAPTRR